MSSEIPTLVPSARNRKHGLYSLSECQTMFHTALERLKWDDRCESQDTHQALQFCRASTIFTHASDVSRHLAEYHVWTMNMKASESRDLLISALALERGVSDLTIRALVRSNGPIVKDVLQRFEPCKRIPWSVVILLLVFVEPLIKGKQTRRAIADFVEALVPIPHDEDWQQYFFTNSAILNVLQIACGAHVNSTRSSRSREVSRVVPPPITGGLHPLKLVEMYHQKPQICNNSFKANAYLDAVHEQSRESERADYRLCVGK